MKVEIINTGTELLLGHVTNTHLPFLAQALFGLGLRVERQITVPDGPMIRQALIEAMVRADLIIVTGGLGPTSDDITREVVAELFRRELIFQPAILEKIHGYFAQRQLTPTDAARVQAMVPQGATVLANHHGTAPGLWLEESGRTVILLPGPPRELKPMWAEQVTPLLVEKNLAHPLHEKIWRIAGLGESAVQELLEEEIRQLGACEIGYCARPGEVDFRLIGDSKEMLQAADKIVRAKLEHAIVGHGDEPLEAVVVRLARAAGKKIATAESCTGGLVSHRLTNVPGSSEVFGFGWVTYANEAKQRELGVPADLLALHGAVSEPVVRAMAEGARVRSGADLAVAISGVAGPGGGTPEKPVGTCWLALSTVEKTVAWRKKLSTDRETFKYMASQQALDLLRRALQNFAPKNS